MKNKKNKLSSKAVFPPFFLFNLIVNTVLFSSGILLIQNIDSLEIIIFKNLKSLNLKFIFYTLRIITGISLLFLPLKLLSYINQTSLKNILLVIFSITFFSIPFSLSPPDSLRFKYKSTSEQQKKHLYSFVKARKEIQTKNTLLCFLTANCRFCKLAGKKIAVISKELETNDKIQIILNNDSTEVIKFLKEIDLSLNFTFHKTTFDTLLNICDGRMPTMFLMKNDSIFNEYNSRSLNDVEILENLNKN